MYPKWKYHPVKEARVVHSEEAEQSLGPEWFESPAEFGVETCPGLVPDPVIQKKGEEYRAKQAAEIPVPDAPSEQPKRQRKAKA